jgi:hypothetical protein
MNTTHYFVLACLCASFATSVSVAAGDPMPAPEAQIAAAVLAAPEDRRAGVAVLGYDANGALVPLREGSNDLVCLADDPTVKGISVVCYHRDLEPYMKRGRELRAEGVPDKLRGPTRWKEVESGTLKVPREPRMLYVLTGTAFDPATGALADAYERWVLYVPFATAESTGLPTTARASAPWLMDAGTAGAHIMITPPRPK